MNREIRIAKFGAEVKPGLLPMRIFPVIPLKPRYFVQREQHPCSPVCLSPHGQSVHLILQGPLHWWGDPAAPSPNTHCHTGAGIVPGKATLDGEVALRSYRVFFHPFY